MIDPIVTASAHSGARVRATSTGGCYARSVRAGSVYGVAAALGAFTWAVLAITGVAALLQRFPEVRLGLTWAGGAFLVLLGIRALLQVRASERSRAPAIASAPSAPAACAVAGMAARGRRALGTWRLPQRQGPGLSQVRRPRARWRRRPRWEACSGPG